MDDLREAVFDGEDVKVRNAREAMLYLTKDDLDDMKRIKVGQAQR